MFRNLISKIFILIFLISNILSANTTKAATSYEYKNYSVPVKLVANQKDFPSH